MNKGLEALEYLKNKGMIHNNAISRGCVDDIEKELKELDKIKARLVVVNMKISAHRKECVENMEHTGEDDFVHEASKIEMDCLDWFREMLKEVLL